MDNSAKHFAFDSAINTTSLGSLNGNRNFIKRAVILNLAICISTIVLSHGFYNFLSPTLRHLNDEPNNFPLTPLERRDYTHKRSPQDSIWSEVRD